MRCAFDSVLVLAVAACSLSAVLLPVAEAANGVGLVSMPPASGPTPTDWKRFADALTGRLVLPSTSGYTADRMQWNTRFLNTPAAIAYCNTTHDVSLSVLFARKHALQLTVRSGGHSTEGWAVLDGGLVVDVSPMKTVVVDSATGVVTAQTGLTLLEYDRATVDVNGVMSPTGLCPSVGLGGYSQGGGIGWTSRSQGLFIDTIARYTMVLANGSVVVAGVDPSIPNSALQGMFPIAGSPSANIVNSELFWALRGGGGGNFGIVTNVTVVTDPAPKEVLYAEYQWDASLASNVTQLFLASTDEHFCFFLLFICPTPGNVMVLMQGIWSGDPAKGTAALAPFHDLATSTGGIASYANMSYSAAKANFSSGGLSVPIAGKQKSAFVPASHVAGMGDASGGVRAIMNAIASIPPAAGGHSSIYMNHMGNQINAPAGDATAFPHRTYAANFVIDAHWEMANETVAQEVVDWTRAAYDAVSPYLAPATYVNYLDRDLCIDKYNPFAPATSFDVYYSSNYARLQAVKDHVDPNGFFTNWPQAINGNCNTTVLP